MTLTHHEAKINALFDTLWQAYSRLNPNVLALRNMLEKELMADLESPLINDHIALRTLRHPLFGIEQLAEPFIQLGYEFSGTYHFAVKRLSAVHLEHPSLEAVPKVFISELMLENCSVTLQQLIAQHLIANYAGSSPCEGLVAASGRSWGTPNYAVYQQLLSESEYAAWFYVFGFVPNHFTVKVNSLRKLQDIYQLNAFLESKGYSLNEAAGKVKGTPEVYLEQSSTRADERSVEFMEGEFRIPTVFYEFAKRYPMPDGKEFSGFIEGNADKIFESTNARRQ